MEKSRNDGAFILLDCKECHEPFKLYDSEVEYLKTTFGDSYSAPVRCKNCRKIKKQRNQNQ